MRLNDSGMTVNKEIACRKEMQCSKFDDRLVDPNAFPEAVHCALMLRGLIKFK